MADHELHYQSGLDRPKPINPALAVLRLALSLTLLFAMSLIGGALLLYTDVEWPITAIAWAAVGTALALAATLVYVDVRRVIRTGEGESARDGSERTMPP